MDLLHRHDLCLIDDGDGGGCNGGRGGRGDAAAVLVCLRRMADVSGDDCGGLVIVVFVRVVFIDA